MAAKLLTTEEKNYLRSIYLTFMIGTDAVRTYFDQLHPPTDLVAHLANNKSAFELLKKDGIISKAVWEKLYPKRGASPTSAEFDITILICLLREMTPKVVAPSYTSFDQLPDIADKSPETCLANIKFYRNFLGHPDKVKLRTLSCTTFDDLFTRVGMAIKVLGNNQYCSEVEKARQLNIDNDFAEILEKFVNHEKQLEDLNGSVEQNRKQTNHLQTLCDKCGDKSDELENEIRTLETSLQEFEKDISDIKSKLKLGREAIEKKVIDLSKQLSEFKTKTNATLALHGKDIQHLNDNINELSEQQQGYDSRTEQLEKKANESKEMQTIQHERIQTIVQEQEEQRMDVKELKEKQQSMSSRTEQLEKKANESKEMQTIQHERIQTIVQEQEEQRMDVKELKEKQQSMSNSPATKGDAHQLTENLYNIRDENKDLKLSSIHRQPMGDNSTVNDSIVVGKTVVGEISVSSNIEEWHLVENYIYFERYYEKLKKCMETKLCVILKGLIGTGKSQLALQYCYTVRKFNPNIIVYKLRCTDTNMFQKSLRELCKCLPNINIIEEEDTQKETLNKLEDDIVRGMRDRNGYQFLLLDDVKPNSKRAVNDFLKKCKRVGNIKLIVTTSVSLDLDPITDEVVEVSGFSENAAVDFLANGKRGDRENYLQLARKFSCNPKGLHIARSFMSQAGLSAGALTRKLNVPLDMLRLEKTVAVRETFMDETLFSSLVSIIRDMHKKYKQEGKEHIFEMILLLQFLEVENIPVVLFTKTSYEASNFYIDDLIYEIKNSSFGTIDGHDDNRKINTHDLVKSALEIYTTQMEDKVLKAKEKLLQKLLRAFFLLIDKDNKHTSDLQRHSLLVPHARAVLEKLKAEMNNKLEDESCRNLEYVIQVIYLKHIIGYTYSFNEMFSEASEYFEDAKKDMFELLNLEKTFQIEFEADCDLLQHESLVCKKTKALYSAIVDFLNNTKHLYSIKNVSEDYVINKYRNAEDANMLSGLLEKHNLEESTHLIKNEYVQLSHRGYAVPFKWLSKQFLYELVISVLHTYGRRLFYLPDKRDIQTAHKFFSYLAVAHELSKLISENEDRDKVRLSSVLTERSVIQSVLEFLCRKTKVHASTLNDKISICKSRLDEKVNYFEFGVLKVLWDDSHYFTVTWVKLIIKCYRKLIKIENTEKVCKEALEWGEDLSEKMKSMKNNTNYPNLVCSLGDLYFATGKILESEKCFEKLLPKHAKVTDKSLASKSTLKRYERKACISYIRCRMNRSCETEEHFDEDTLQRLEAYKLLLQGYVNDLEDLKEMEVQLKGRLRGETEFYCRLQIPKPNC